MNDIELRKLIVAEYDEAVLAASDGLTQSEVRDRIWQPVAEYLETADRDFEAEAKRYIGSVLHNERQNRTNQLHREIEWLQDYWANPEDAGIGVEVLLDRAYPMGTAKGEDKALRFWTVEDLQNKIMGYYRTAADATESARRNDTVLSQLILEMQAHGALTIGELSPMMQVAA